MIVLVYFRRFICSFMGKDFSEFITKDEQKVSSQKSERTDEINEQQIYSPEFHFLKYLNA